MTLGREKRAACCLRTLTRQRQAVGPLVISTLTVPQLNPPPSPDPLWAHRPSPPWWGGDREIEFVFKSHIFFLNS